MTIETEILGVLEYNEEDVITFSEGLYGFTDKKRFILINMDDQELPFQWLQSVEDGQLSFILTNPFLFFEDYDFELPQTMTEDLHIETLEHMSIYSIAVIKEDLQESTLNLKAPIVMNTHTKVARQLILNEEYPYRFKFFNKN